MGGSALSTRSSPALPKAKSTPRLLTRRNATTAIMMMLPSRSSFQASRFGKTTSENFHDGSVKIVDGFIERISLGFFAFISASHFEGLGLGFVIDSRYLII